MWKSLAGCLTVVSALGCGLSDYEARMDVQRERMRIFDEENKVLSGCIHPPTKKEKGGAEKLAVPFDIFLRIPKGFHLGVKIDKNGLFLKDASFDVAGLTFYRFEGIQGTNFFLAAATVPTPTKDDKRPAGVFSKEEFKNNVRAGLHAIFQRNFPAIKPNEVNKQPQSHKTEKLQPLAFEEYIYGDDKMTVAVYYHERNNRQVALIYQYTKQMYADPSTGKGIDVSLKSLDISDAAFGKRLFFNKNKRL
ncbi:MAG: hypothetical protein L0Y72_21255 [Gemmataceae bacterium]|nr:hypothetical protein [Gemmataceae bacterium]MCI0741571.1 hypothetical protein [Gemmataceae bacterium]